MSMQILRRGSRLIAPVLLFTAFTGSSAEPGNVAVADEAPEMRLSGDRISLPIVMVREFPFIEGEIAGVKGKLMLDTGMQQGMMINDHRVSLAGGTKTGTGHFGSGQTFDIRRHSTVPNIRVGNIRFAKVSSVTSQDARMLERITPDFIGWIGYGFFSNYAMKVDYRRLRATFYKGGPASYTAGEKVVAILPFETRRLPNIPLLSARIGSLDAIASLDTGMYGSLATSAKSRQLLLDAGHLKPAANPDEYNLTGVRLGNTVTTDLPAIEVEEGPSAAAKPIGITEDTEVELGYAFLRQYKVVWDFPGKRLYLLAP